MEKQKEFVRKYSFEETLDESIERLNHQLKRLNERTHEHFRKRKKLLLQLERQNNYYRRRKTQFDDNLRMIIDENLQIIREIKLQIIRDDRHERQRRTEQHQRIYQRPLTSLFLLIGILFLTTVIIFLRNKSNNQDF